MLNKLIFFSTLWFILSCSSLPVRIYAVIAKQAGSVEACANYLSGNSNSIKDALNELSEEDRLLIEKQNTPITTQIPVLSFNPYMGRAELYYSNGDIAHYTQTVERQLSPKEIIEWKCAERIRMEIDDKIGNAEIMYMLNPMNSIAILKEVHEATSYYSNLSKSIIGKSDLLRSYLYLPVIGWMSQSRGNYYYACELLAVAGPVALEASLKGNDSNLKKAFLSSSAMAAGLERASYCSGKR
ncbi:hypothetical protein [Leptospira licerasiae]|uniref:hypothetical protein n=1 Tax=Leptospira licerasiae TaxID=447106 RepID=UPI00301A3B71